MDKIYIVGNPNSGKTTLFNSITKSSEHVGNWHGVTVDKTSKCIQFKSKTSDGKNVDDKTYEIVDLPGIYSLNPYSLEEQVSIDEINSNDCNKIFYLIDANNFKRGLLLAMYLLIKNKNIKILINNYKSFKKSGRTIDVEYLNKVLGCQVEIIDAQKFRPNSQFFEFSTKQTAFVTMLQNHLANNVEDKIKNTQMLYEYILKICDNAITKNKDIKIYGYSKFDRKFLRLAVFVPAFLILMFAIVYITFFLIGPVISDWFLKLMYMLFQKPVMSILKLATSSKFFISLFEEGIFGACFSVLGFLPQIALMYLFLSILENSGFISRMAFVLDDVLEKVGLNGKMIYTLLMGFGCSTTASLSAKNMPETNSKIKATLITPLISCSAKLPIYSVVAGVLFGANSVFVIFGLYLLGIVLAIIMAVVISKILSNTGSNLLIEFPPLKVPNFKNIYMSIKTSCKQFITKVCGIIFATSVVLWLLANVNIKFQYVGESGRSILYSFSSIISWIFKPIGLNNPNIISALIIGLVAKELILSSFAISNKVTNLKVLGTSLSLTTSAVNFNIASGVSFLIFTLLYFPCASNFGVMTREAGAKTAWLGVGVQLVMAYTIAYLFYSLVTKGLVFVLITICVFLILILVFKILYKKIKSKKIFCNCLNCNKCKNK